MAEGTGDLPSIPDFEDRYWGEWESFREDAEELAALRGAEEEQHRLDDCRHQ